MSVAADGAAAFEHKVDGGRAQGNGNNGPGATILNMPLPAQTLTVSNLFGDGTLVFPISALDKGTRLDLDACFAANEATK